MADVLHPSVTAWLTDIDRQGKSALTCAGYRRALANFVHWSEQTYGQPFDPSAIIPRDIADWKAFQQTVKETTPYGSVDHLFHKAYYSHEIGFRKPDVDAYRYIIAEKGLDAGQTLFIDDNKFNIEGAREAGLQTKLLLPGERVEKVLGYLL